MQDCAWCFMDVCFRSPMQLLRLLCFKTLLANAHCTTDHRTPANTMHA